MKKILILFCLLILVGCSNTYIKGNLIQPTDVNVNLKEYLDDIEEYLDLYLDSFINDGDILIDNYKGYPIVWNIEHGEAVFENNVIHKKENAKEYESVVISAEVNGKKYLFDNVELLDKYVGYLMTYFVGDGLKNEQVYYGWTYDGLLWYPINFQKPVLKATIGTRRLRDPSIIRQKNGKFTLVATEGFDNPDIFAFDTTNLIDFENERLINVNKSSDVLALLEKQAWAPEGFYDRRIDKYVIYWSSPTDKKMFYNYSSDLNDISYPYVLVDVGFPVIDGTLLKEDGGYSIVLKDERMPMEKHSQLFVGYSEKDYTQIEHFDFNFFSGHQSEGPFIIQRGYDFLLYYDDYTRHKFKAYQFYELKANIFEEIKDTDIISSINNLKHGSVIPLTWKEFERIKEKYDVGEN